VTFVALGLAAVIALQVARVVRHNLVLADELSSLRRDVRDLEKKQAGQRRTIERLRDPQGAVPEIHDRLRLVRPDETIIYVKRSGSGATQR
jgi:cell division protein FtsB